MHLPYSSYCMVMQREYILLKKRAGGVGISSAAFCSQCGKKLPAKWVRISISAHQCNALHLKM